ncbi:MAG TPA: ribosome small subunit-dependent GTPase A [Gammaproteobacteria bacterium]
MSEAPAGRVIVNFRRHSVVERDGGERVDCIVKGRKLKPVAGDRVRWEALENGDDGQGVIVEILPRHGVIERYDTVRDRQVLAANVDQAIIVNAIEPAMDAFTLDKYLAAAEANGVEPFIVLNKIDLASEAELAALDSRLDVYRQLGYRVQFLSTETGAGIDAFLDRLAGRTSILVGASGVGKSAITRLMLPDEDIRVGDISTASGEGRHTTTATTLYHLPAGGDLIDSPGVREYRLWPIPPREVAPLFREIRERQGECRFLDCLHRKEPGCAVKAAVESGAVNERRYASYLALVGIMEDQYRSY